MPSDARFRVFSLIAFGCIVTAASASPAQSQSPPHPASSAADSQAQAELSRTIAGILSDTSSHMRMGPTRTATAADSARAAAIVLAARAALSQYVDVKVAERDGYYRNLPWLDDQPIYHYNRLQNFSAAQQGAFDPTKPVSLLYKKDGRGQLRLFGAMYATRELAASEDLDALLPISMAHWHEHVNLCYPGRNAARDGPQKVDAGMVFLVKLFFSITSARECETAGGRFVPVEFGWMAHVYMFAGSDDPKVIWDADDLGNVDVHMGHPPTNTRR
jgi:hypothetical protein